MNVRSTHGRTFSCLVGGFLLTIAAVVGVTVGQSQSVATSAARTQVDVIRGESSLEARGIALASPPGNFADSQRSQAHDWIGPVMEDDPVAMWIEPPFGQSLVVQWTPVVTEHR